MSLPVADIVIICFAILIILVICVFVRDMHQFNKKTRARNEARMRANNTATDSSSESCTNIDEIEQLPRYTPPPPTYTQRESKVLAKQVPIQTVCTLSNSH